MSRLYLGHVWIMPRLCLGHVWVVPIIHAPLASARPITVASILASLMEIINLCLTLNPISSLGMLEVRDIRRDVAAIVVGKPSSTAKCEIPTRTREDLGKYVSNP
jgi:hypothetical protein